jgi:hypothetical protein
MGRCVRLTTLPPSCAVVKKSGDLNFLETSGPPQALIRTALLYSPPPLLPNFRYPSVLNWCGMVWCQCSEGCEVLKVVKFESGVPSCSWDHDAFISGRKGLRIESAHYLQLRAGRAGDRIPSGARGIFFYRTVQTVSGGHPLSSSVAAEPFSQG